VLCPAFAQAQAQAAGRTLDQELQFLTTHGTLHLIGYDHATQEEYDTMFSLQDVLLEGWRGA
jgi:probable rRNA maturation factor